jgi:hypothetical protein
MLLSHAGDSSVATCLWASTNYNSSCANDISDAVNGNVSFKCSQGCADTLTGIAQVHLAAALILFDLICRFHPTLQSVPLCHCS